MNMTLKAMCNKYRSSVGQRQKSEISKRYNKELFEFVSTMGRGFLFPNEFKSCEHEWAIIDSGYACCSQCGKEHECGNGGIACPFEISNTTEKICTITGCIISGCESRAERNAEERIGSMQECKASKIFDSRKHQNGVFSAQTSFQLLQMCNLSVSDFHDLVHGVVKDMLDSDKTKMCFWQERQRNESKMIAILSKLLRDASHDKRCMKPIMPKIFGEMFHICRKSRNVVRLDRYEINNIINDCTQSIMNLLLKYGSARVARYFQNNLRSREFVCSMLYLMRMGITYQKRQLLPQLKILNDILPLQALLPIVYKIRAKSITEGENIIKLDIRRMPL